MRVTAPQSASAAAGAARTRSSRVVTEIIEEVRARGDEAVLEFTERFDHAELGPSSCAWTPNELEASVGRPRARRPATACERRSRT